MQHTTVFSLHFTARCKCEQKPNATLVIRSRDQVDIIVEVHHPTFGPAHPAVKSGKKLDRGKKFGELNACCDSVHCRSSDVIKDQNFNNYRT